MIAIVREVAGELRECARAAVPRSADRRRASRAQQHAAYRAALAAAGSTSACSPADEATPRRLLRRGHRRRRRRRRAGHAAGRAVAAARDRRRSRRRSRTQLELAHDGRAGDARRRRLHARRHARSSSAARRARTRPASRGSPRCSSRAAIASSRSTCQRDVLHLKCVCAPLGDDRITLADGDDPARRVRRRRRRRIPADESYAANVLAIGDRVLVADGFPRTASARERQDSALYALDTTRIPQGRRRADLPVRARLACHRRC